MNSSSHHALSPKKPRRRWPWFLGGVGVGIVATSLIGSALAANITLGSGPIEFGQGTQVVSACDPTMSVIPYDVYSAGAFKLDMLRVYFDAPACAGKAFDLIFTADDVSSTDPSRRYAAREHKITFAYTLVDSPDPSISAEQQAQLSVVSYQIDGAYQAIGSPPMASWTNGMINMGFDWVYAGEDTYGEIYFYPTADAASEPTYVDTRSINGFAIETYE